MRKFKKVYVEITNICNLNCSFCPKNARAKKFMSVEEFEKIASIISPITNTVSLHVMGEPLLHPNLPEIFNICKKYNLNTHLTTNGTLLKQKKDLLKTGCCRRIFVSLHSYEANQHTFSLNEYLQDIFTSCKEIAQNGTFIEFRLWNESNNTSTKNKLNKEIIDYACKFFKAKVDILNPKKYHNLTENIYLGFDNVFEWPINTQETEKHALKFCYGLRTHFAILCDGTVIPCCFDSEGKLKLGNIFEKPLEDILTSTRAEKIYKGFTDRNATEDFCKTCVYADKFLEK